MSLPVSVALENKKTEMNNSNETSSFGRVLLGSCVHPDGEINKFDGALFIIISFLAIVGNIIVFLCYSRYRVLRTITNVFIISLSASDLLVAIISIPYSFGVFVCSLYPDYQDEKLGTLIYLTCDMIPSILSIYSLTLVAVDRAIAISKPFFHSKNITRRTAWIAVACTWCFVSSLVSFLYVLDPPQFTLFIILMAYAIPVGIMIVSYLIMGFVAKKHASELSQLDKTISRLRADARNKQEASEAMNNNGSLLTEESHLNGYQFTPLVVTYKKNGSTEIVEKNQRNWFRKSVRRLSSLHVRPRTRTITHGMRTRRREMKAALTLSMILSCFILSWTPFIALNIEYFRCPNCRIDHRVTKYFKLLHYTNSALNPILYILLNKRWRAAFKKVVCFKMNNSHDSDATTELFGW